MKQITPVDYWWPRSESHVGSTNSKNNFAENGGESAVIVHVTVRASTRRSAELTSRRISRCTVGIRPSGRNRTFKSPEHMTLGEGGLKNSPGTRLALVWAKCPGFLPNRLRGFGLDRGYKLQNLRFEQWSTWKERQLPPVLCPKLW